MFRRGDVVTCVFSGDYGKPRPAVIVQSDIFNDTHPSLTICPLTTHLVEAPLFRIAVMPTNQNGLKKPSQIMVDKISTIKADKADRKVGFLNPGQIGKMNEALRFWLEL